jgi:hypothetical protein
MATHMLMNPWYVGNKNFPYRRFVGGPGDKSTTYVEAASQTWISGDLIFMNDASNLTICGEDGSGHYLTGPIAGQALKKATGTTGTKTHFAVIRPGDRFFMNVYHGTAASAITAKTQIGDRLPVRHASSRWMVDIETTGFEDATHADAVVKVVGFPLWHPLLNVPVAIGDIYGLVEVEFIPISIASDGTPIIDRLQFA